MKITALASCCGLMLCLAAAHARAEPAAAPTTPALPGGAAANVIFSIGPRGEVFEYRPLDMLGGPDSHATSASEEAAALPPEPDSHLAVPPVPEPSVYAAPAWGAMRAFEPVRALPALPPEGTAEIDRVLALPPAEQIAHQTEAYVPVAPPVPFEQFVRQPSNSGITGGAAVLVLAPLQLGSEAYALNSGQQSNTASVAYDNFGYTAQAAPLIWLGWQFDGDSGIRTRFFWFNAISRASLTGYDPDQPMNGDKTLSPPPGLELQLPGRQQFLSPGSSVLFVGGYDSNAAFSSYMRLYSIDLEYTHEWNAGGFESVFAAGGRYLNVDQSYSAFASASGVPFGSVDAHYETQTLSSTQNFSGGGPTAAWLGRMRLGTSALKAYGGVRGSLLAGTFTDRIAFVDNDYNTSLGTLANTTGWVVNNVSFGALPVGELESGIEFDQAVGSRRWFSRIGVVAIDYFGLGQPNGSTADLVLIGAELAAGIRY